MIRLSDKSLPAAAKLRCSTLAILVCAVTALLAMPAWAQSSRFGPRAGSYFSGNAKSYGKISRRPYRRSTQQVGRKSSRDEPSAEYDSRLDYRLETAEAPDADFLDSYRDPAAEEFAQDFAVEPAGLQLANSYGCSCGSCVEPDCGCEDDCDPGCGCDDYCSPGCGCDDYCEPGCGCEDPCCTFPSCTAGCRSTWGFGFEWTFLKPRFSENVAFTRMESDGGVNATFSDFTDTEFDYDLELTPRVWIEAALNNSWSWRASYWQFDHAPAVASGTPGPGAFNEVTHPPFLDVDISSTIATDIFSATSNLNALTIDIEALKHARISGWDLGVGGGVRYASVEQGYFAQLRNAGDVLRGQIDFDQTLDGIGPTIFLSGSRPLFKRIQLNCAARGSVLFGDGSSRLTAQEDLDLANPFTTTRTTNRDDLLPIGEARVGLQWMSPGGPSGFQWLFTSAMEGQIWGNAGNATSESGDLGFFGFNVGAGFQR